MIREPRGVLVTSRSFGSGASEPKKDLEQAGLEVIRGTHTHDLEDLAAVLGRCVAWIAGTGSITEEHLDAAPGLRVIARYGVGVDAVDLEAARRREVRVTNTPGANTGAVADHTIALLLALLRGVGVPRTPGGSETVPPRELGALRVGLVGFGRIGREVAQRLRGFGSQVVVHDPVIDPDDARRAGVTMADLVDLATSSDVVSLHRPGGEVVVDRSLLASFGPSTLLVNVARADLVDEASIAEALQEGMLGGYATDVVAEPGGPLSRAPRVLVTDHVAAQTREAIDRMGQATVEEVLRALAGRPALSPVVEP